jgi:hypothetical protein
LAIGRTKRHTGGVPNVAMDCLAISGTSTATGV